MVWILAPLDLDLLLLDLPLRGFDTEDGVQIVPHDVIGDLPGLEVLLVREGSLGLSQSSQDDVGEFVDQLSVGLLQLDVLDVELHVAGEQVHVEAVRLEVVL